MTVNPLRVLNKLFIVILLSLILFFTIFSWSSWLYEKQEQIYNLVNLMELEGTAINKYLFQLVNSMKHIDQEIKDYSNPIDSKYVYQLIKILKQRRTDLFNITFIRADGQVLCTANTPPSANLPTLANEESFKTFLNELNETTVYDLGRPLISVIAKEWIIPLRYVIRDEKNDVSHIISMNIPIRILEEFWKTAPFTSKAALGLIRNDGFLVARYPVPGKAHIQDVYGKPRTGDLMKYLRLNNFPETGYIEGLSSLEGPDYLYTFKKLENFPVTLFINIPINEIYHEWLHKVTIPYALAFVFIIIICIIYIIVSKREISGDITQRLLESEKHELELKLEKIQKAESLKRMAGAIAHNFNNMLAVVIGNLELIETSKELPITKIKYYINESLKGAKKAADISQLMLAYLGHTNTKLETIDSVKFLDDIISFVSMKLPSNVCLVKKEIDYKFDFKVDIHCLKQMFINIINNAVEAIGEEEGTITLDIKEELASNLDNIQHTYPIDQKLEHNKYVCFYVTDTGCGLSLDELNRIFDPFFTTKFIGRGLGLAVVLGLVRSHQGVIQVNSIVNQGTTFKICIPA